MAPAITGVNSDQSNHELKPDRINTVSSSSSHPASAARSGGSCRKRAYPSGERRDSAVKKQRTILFTSYHPQHEQQQQQGQERQQNTMARCRKNGDQKTQVDLQKQKKGQTLSLQPTSPLLSAGDADEQEPSDTREASRPSFDEFDGKSCKMSFTDFLESSSSSSSSPPPSSKPLPLTDKDFPQPSQSSLPKKQQQSEGGRTRRERRINNQHQEEGEDEEEGEGTRKMIGVEKLRVGDLVVVGRSFLDLNLIARETYEIKAIYYQRIG
mmetsp:Transcript_30564/g.49047  ORF Transcript_30564/g.49047 Transcript_30564/m.49047 type:complete len:268 (-) Transcript_30564:86-889(-)